MKERPILFSGPMVRAILAGQKSQTRRVISPQPHVTSCQVQTPPEQIDDLIKAAWAAGFVDVKCPYGQAGDRLWVRETWGFDHGVRHDFRPIDRTDLSGMDLLEHVLYGAQATEDDKRLPPKWRPSIHMPRWVSRITLEVTSVRVERLQAISEDGARAEGVEELGSGDCDECADNSCAACVDSEEAYPETSGNRLLFAELWDRINGKRAPWASSPWVWVVGFKRVEAPR